ncbi:MAG: HAMP domain-containing sensor histidine kinase [Rhizobiaceae bacterium]
MISRLLPNSLAYRLLAMITLWTSVALLVTGIILSTIVRANEQRSFEQLLQAYIQNLMSVIDIDAQGNVIGSPDFGDSRFVELSSGWFWTIAKAETAHVPIAHSASFSGNLAELPVEVTAPFDADFKRVSVVTDPLGKQLMQVESQLTFDEDETLYQFRVTGNTRDVDRAVSEFNRTLIQYFLLYGGGTILATFFLIRIGLRPLSAATDALHDVREGHKEQLNDSYPVEIQPLVGEINALITTNRSIVDRARTQVGNLAHALKTPLAVIVNEVRSSKNDQSDLIAEQADLMKSQVQTYLDRARIAAQRDVIVSRTPVIPVLNKLVRVMQRLSPDIDFNINNNDETLAFRGEEQDLEEIFGNLLENACRFAESEVHIAVHDMPGGVGVGDGAAAGPPRILIEIEDDGKGLSPEQRVKALKRGIRLDESQPGSGLGLAIVRDIATEYGGSFTLDEGKSGGLKAVIVLPKLSSSSR